MTIAISILVLFLMILYQLNQNWIIPFFIPPVINDTQWWHYFTQSLVHFSLVHGVFNLIFFIIIGYYNEPVWGSIRFLLLCIGTSISGSLISKILYPEITVGLSDVIAGICGAVVARGYWYREYPEVRKWGIFYLKIILFSIFNSLILYLVAGPISADLTHLAGLFSGMIIATIFIFVEKQIL